MCGIYGIVSAGEPLGDRSTALESMGDLLRHRGPDAHGMRALDRAAFGAERLRVFDTTPSGDQPFADPTGRIMLVLNGAVYNAPDLRRRYRDYPFQSTADSEVVLPLYLERGAAGIEALDGMFALALYDDRDGTLLLARDRAGEKPLFYSRQGDELWFASEMQALLDIACPRQLNRSALRQFAVLGYVTEPATVFAQIKRVEAGTVLTFASGRLTTERYWDPETVAETGSGVPHSAQSLERLLLNAVQKQLRADVPVGVFTSGGVDSGLIAALAARTCGKQKISTFTVGFAERAYDESREAEWLANHLGADHLTIQTSETSLLAAMHEIIDSVAEPIADPAVVPTYLLAREARRYVTVVLGGEGADELFGGYPTYLGHRIAQKLGRLPKGVRRAAWRGIQMIPTSTSRKVPVEYLLKRFVTAAELPFPERHLRWFGTGLDPAAVASDCERAEAPDSGLSRPGDPVALAGVFDYRTYLRDNLLTKVDRAAMLSSLEARAPFLDAGVSRFGLSLDPTCKVRGLTTKWFLKKVASRWLPRRVVHRRKRGLSVPTAEWLNGALRSDVDRLLSPQRVGRRGLVRPEIVQRLVAEHRSGKANHCRALWPLLILEYWLERWVPEE